MKGSVRGWVAHGSEALDRPHSNLQSTPESGVIDIRLRELSALFDSLDPSAFKEQDLRRNVEEYIVESISELSLVAPCALVIHLDEPTGHADEESIVQSAVRGHFARRANTLRRDLRRLIRRGLISLVIGVSFLCVFSAVSRVIPHLLGDGPLPSVMQEGIAIVGWVAMWRPLEVFLYDWWPIVGERRVYDRLSRIAVRIIPTSVGARRAPAPAPQAGMKESARALSRWEGEGGRVAAPARPPSAEQAP